jgi:hypothetical protein
MTNNIDKILPLLVFDKQDDFFFLQILQRKKENPKLGSNSRVVKNYYIKSRVELEEKYDEIKALCEIFNARACIRLNKRNFKKVAFKAMVNVANTMANGEYQHVKGSYDRACGKGHDAQGNKRWILDIDGDFASSFLKKIETHINNLQPAGDKIIAEIPSKFGTHLITKPFNTEQWSMLHPNIEIHKDNPTNLFIP